MSPVALVFATAVSAFLNWSGGGVLHERPLPSGDAVADVRLCAVAGDLGRLILAGSGAPGPRSTKVLDVGGGAPGLGGRLGAGRGFGFPATMAAAAGRGPRARVAPRLGAAA
eukprot:943382-Pyramimonas_sp.AAC.1